MIAWKEFFRSRRTMSYVLTLAILTGIYSCLPFTNPFNYLESEASTPELHAALSLIVGWLLVFRTNTAHARWWEARTLWGALVNAARNLALKISRLNRIPAADLARVRELMIEFPKALKLQLREESTSQLMQDAKLPEHWQHAPLAITAELYEFLGRWKRDGYIDGDELRVIDAELLRFMDICGGCERIQKTRIIRVRSVLCA